MKSTFESWLKFILFGCLVGVGISACSDDALEGGENPDVQGDNTPAYLTVSFSTAGNSSRSTADDANNTGDKDGSAEDSGHHNDGTESENTVSDALVVIVPETGNTAWAKLYTIMPNNEKSTTPDVGIVNEFSTTTTPAGTTTYCSSKPIKLSVGEYRVLVIANPPQTLKSLAFENDNSMQELTNVTAVKELYQIILDGAFDATSMTKFTGNEENDLAGESNFMMANKGEGVDEASKLIKLTSSNDENNPALANIEIERAVAKITFRQTEMTNIIVNNGAFEEGTTKLSANIYPVKIVTGAVNAKTIEANVDGQDGNETLNCAIWTKADGTEMPVYVLINKTTGGETYYQEANGTYTELTGKDAPKESEVELLYDDEQAEKQVWYVKLEEYALVNVMKKTNYVRHTIAANGLESPFGKLNGNNFLWTPYWDAINAVTFSEDGNFEGTPATNTWFWNTLEDVSKESKGGNDEGTEKLFQTFPWAVENAENENESTGDVTGTGNEQHTNEDALANIGWTLDYVFENATDIAHQTHGLSTGISLKAGIYKNADCSEKVNSLYRYDGHLFETIQDMVTAYGENATDAMKTCLSDESVENLANAGIEKFDGNTCYYYTTEIKHFDNDNPRVMGNMEFAVMRNNIYSLAVTGIKVIGDPYVDPTPSTPDETSDAYLTVEAKIMPWIVRYHDIEFE